MSIRDFVRNSRNNRRRNEGPAEPVAPEIKVDPLKTEPETAEQLASYLSERSARPTSRANRGTTLHTVKQSETLETISTKYFGDAEGADAIASANLIDLTNDTISVGDILTIPI